MINNTNNNNNNNNDNDDNDDNDNDDNDNNDDNDYTVEEWPFGAPLVREAKSGKDTQAPRRRAPCQTWQTKLPPDAGVFLQHNPHACSPAWCPQSGDTKSRHDGFGDSSRLGMVGVILSLLPIGTGSIHKALIEGDVVSGDGFG
jgi:hypothetical protein